MIAHSHPMHRRYSIEFENIEASEKDTEVMKQFPFRAWNWKVSSGYEEMEYVHFIIPILGIHPVAIVTFNDENVLNPIFPILRSDSKRKQIFLISNISILFHKYSLFYVLDYDNKKEARFWEINQFPCEELNIKCEKI